MNDNTTEKAKEVRKEWISKLYKITKNQPSDNLTRWAEMRARELGVS